MRTPSDLEKAYIAGVIDGEGCIQIEGTLHSTICLQVANTDERLIKFLEEIYGGSVHKVTWRSYLTRNGKKQKPGITWRVRADLAYRVIGDILPYLKIKKEQSMIAIALYEFNKSNYFINSQGIPSNILNIRNAHYESMCFLNQKGVPG